MQFNIPKNQGSPIKVIGVGGGGSNAVNYMHQQGINGVDFIVCNTDNQALEASSVPTRIQLGTTLTAGQGAGSIPEIGKNAAIENLDDVLNQLTDDTTMVFITAGMGGGTGTGAAPVIAQACKDLDILTVGIVTVPFNFEGKRRANQAAEGLERMRAAVDTLLVIRNDKLRELFGNLALKQAFSNADEVLCTAAKGIAEVITLTGDINVDMNDVKTVMRDSGAAIMGAGAASGDGRAMTAVAEALESPLLNDNDITGANFVLLNITYGTDELLMDEISEITDYIQDQAGATAEVIWGYGHDETLGEKICVTVIATGFEARADLPEGPTEKRQHLGDGGREITQPLDGPIPSEPWETSATVADDEPRLKTDAAPTALNEDAEPTLLTNQWQAEEVTSDTPDAALDLFGAPTDAVEEVQLRHEVLEETPEVTAPIEATVDATSEVEPVEEPITASAETVGGFTVLNLDEVEEETITPEQVAGVTFTDQEVGGEVDTPQEEVAANAQPIPTPSTPQPEVDTEPAPAPAPRPLQQGIDMDDLAARTAQRQFNIEERTKRLRTPNGLTELESEPAFKRRNIQLEPTPSSDESQATRLSIDEETGGLKTDNPFLHDNVD
ncbi:MAG: cell division protein FtsZ [Flavobacteriales bacterium]